jgi:hypothetical protein
MRAVSRVRQRCLLQLSGVRLQRKPEASFGDSQELKIQLNHRVSDTTTIWSH